MSLTLHKKSSAKIIVSPEEQGLLLDKNEASTAGTKTLENVNDNNNTTTRLFFEQIPMLSSQSLVIFRFPYSLFVCNYKAI
jgi:hypothetical protein